MMRIRLLKLTLASALFVAAMAAPIGALAQNQSGEDVLVDVTLKGADLVEATLMLTKQTGLQFVFEGTEEPYQKVTCRLARISARDALTQICAAAGAYFIRDENGVYIIKHKREKLWNPWSGNTIHRV